MATTIYSRYSSEECVWTFKATAFKITAHKSISPVYNYIIGSELYMEDLETTVLVLKVYNSQRKLDLVWNKCL